MEKDLPAFIIACIVLTLLVSLGGFYVITAESYERQLSIGTP